MTTMTKAGKGPSRNPIVRAYRWFFYRGHGDSPFKRLLIHITLIIACVIAVYPVLRVVTISLRPNDTLLTTSLRIIPENATLNNYKLVLFGDVAIHRKSDFFLWIVNSFSVVIVTSILSVILAAVSAYAFSRFKFRGRSFGLIFLLTTSLSRPVCYSCQYSSCSPS
jgi:arabinogalactan oligomer/maltooligosaccharide transport system permease protein